MKKWLKKRAHPITTEISSKEELAKLKKLSKVSVVYLGPKNENFEVFEETAGNFPKIRFYHSFSSSLFAANGNNGLTMFKRSEPNNPIHYRAAFGIQELQQWITDNG